VSALRCLAVRRYPDVAIRADVKGDKVWQYELAFNQDNQRRVQIKKEKVTCDSTVFLDRPNLEDEQDPARLSQTYLEQVNVNKEFRVLADIFQSIRYRHIVPQLVREPDPVCRPLS
jgi:hypothetical protein